MTQTYNVTSFESYRRHTHTKPTDCSTWTTTVIGSLDTKDCDLIGERKAAASRGQLAV